MSEEHKTENGWICAKNTDASWWQWSRILFLRYEYFFLLNRNIQAVKKKLNLIYIPADETDYEINHATTIV